MNWKRQCFMIVSFFVAGLIQAQAVGFYEFRGDYLGHSSPGETPEVFITETGSAEKPNLNAVFSPDGNTFFYTVEVIPGRTYKPYIRYCKDGLWSDPKVVSLYESYRIGEPFITPDGKKLFFQSMITEDNSSQINSDIWQADVSPIGFVNPQKIGLTVNSQFNEAYPTVSSRGTLYFHSNREGGIGGVDLYCSEFIDNQFLESVNLGENINSPFPELHPFIAPDETYLIFSSLNRPDGLGGIDLYIAYRNNEGNWMKAINLGKNINSSGNDYMPFVSYDRKYFFFTSTRMLSDNIENQTNQSQFGKPNIYWVDAKFVNSFRP